MLPAPANRGKVRPKSLTSQTPGNRSGGKNGATVMTKPLVPWFLVVWLSGVVGALPERTALDPAPVAPGVYAIVVGINDYADKKIQPRQHAEADAKALYDLLTNKDSVGADPKNVR